MTHGRDNRWQVIATVAVLVAASAAARAQSRVVVTPAVSVGTLYDGNILSAETAIADHIWRVSPSIDFTRDGPRSNLLGDAAVDGEWFARYGEFSTPAARQHAAVTSMWKTNAVTQISLAAGYDSSLYPNDITTETSLILGRTRAWNVFAGPQLRRSLGSTWELDADYKLSNDDSELTPGILTQHMGAGAVHALAGRDEIRVRYVGELYHYQDLGLVRSEAALAGWTHLISPTLRLIADGGLRWAEGETRPEVDLQLVRRTTFTSQRATFAMLRTPTLGTVQLVDVKRATALFYFERPHGLGVFTNTGLYFNHITSSDLVRIFDVSAEVRVPILSMLSLAASYSYEAQNGRLLVVTDADLGDVGSTSVDGPPSVSQGLSPQDTHVQRNVVLVRFIVAKSIRSLAGQAVPPVLPGQQPHREPDDGR